MHAADSRAHFAERREERLQVLRISHDGGKGHRADFLFATIGGRFRAGRAAAAQRCAAGLRRSIQEVARIEILAALLPGSRTRAPRHFQRRSRSEEHTSELQSLAYLVCRLLLE